MSYSSIDSIWVLLGTVLVFFMQAGFAMVETGFTRAKNAGNIIMKNLLDFVIGSIVYWLIGFSLMFGKDCGGFIGAISLLIRGDLFSLPGNVGKFTFVMFQTVFCATSATIVSGAMAERTKFLSYCVYSAVISAVIYPVSGHWIWGGGWLSQLGFHDFAGSTAVHMVGGVAALIGAKLLGPRIGKYKKDGTPTAIPGHSLTLGALGVFILWFCWFGFNGGSTLGMVGYEETTGNIFMTTNLAAATATLGVMILTWVRYKKPDVSMTLNGALAGLVAITAGCDEVSNVGAFCIGLIAAFVVTYGIEFVERRLKIDDPVGAIGVHALCGSTGTLLCGLFATSTYESGIRKGLLYGGGLRYLGVQALGVFSVIVWVTLTMLAVFTVIRKTIGLRVSAQEEIRGLDIEEHGLVSSYADFMPMLSQGEIPIGSAVKLPVASKDEAIPVEVRTADGTSASKMSKISIVTKQSMFERLKAAMDEIGVTGMTVTQVLGCGMQKGRPEYYRGVQMESSLLPKIEVEIVVCKIPVRTVIEAAKAALYTGHIGDGKIFIYDVENVVKVRTGEEGYDALQDVE